MACWLHPALPDRRRSGLGPRRAGHRRRHRGTAGIDYLIGEPGLCGRGYGAAAISLFTALTFRRYPQAGAVVAVPQQDNVASWCALERAGLSRWWSGQLDSSDPSDAGAAYLYGTGRPAATG